MASQIILGFAGAKPLAEYMQKQPISPLLSTHSDLKGVKSKALRFSLP